MTLALAGLVAGFVHVLSGPDHLAAIAPYAVTGKRRAWRMGVRWGLGHGAGVLIVGILALLLRHALPVEMLSAWSEWCVGLVLVAIGIWGLRRAFVGHVHSGRHGGGVAVAVGTLHGLAGSSHLLGILPALALPSNLAAGAYLLAFVAGSVAAMGVFAALLGSVAGAARVQRALLGFSSALAVGVGLFWMVR
jgi:hypothetical protein